MPQTPATETIHHAAVYAARAMLEPGMVAGLQPGGQLTITTDVENYPGFPEILGPELMDKFKEHALKFGTSFYEDVIVDVDFSVRPFVMTGDSGKIYTSDAVVIATGAQAKWLGLESEEKFKGFGVSACATCDGFFYRGKEVIVVGGILVHRRDELRSEKILQKRLFENDKVEILWNTTLEEVLGDENPLGVTGARLKNVKTGDVYDRDVHGIFIAIGHKPSTEVFKGHVKMNDGGYIETAADSTATDIPGVFAAGDVSDEIYRQAVTAAGLGCMGALEAEHWLAEQGAAAKVSDAA